MHDCVIMIYLKHTSSSWCLVIVSICKREGMRFNLKNANKGVGVREPNTPICGIQNKAFDISVHFFVWIVSRSSQDVFKQFCFLTFFVNCKNGRRTNAPPPLTPFPYLSLEPSLNVQSNKMVFTYMYNNYFYSSIR